MTAQMLAMFIAIFLVLAVMLYFIVVSLRIVVENASKKVNSFFLSKLREYDDEFAEKIKDIEKLEDYRGELKRDIKELQKEQKSLQTSRFFAPRPLIRDTFIPLARYIDNDFFGDYKKAKKLLEMDKAGIIRTVLERYPYKGDIERYRAANSIHETLNFEALYDLSTSPPEDQLDFLKENLGSDEKKLLLEFIKDMDEVRKFDVLEFVSWIRQIINLESPVLTAYLGDPTEDYSDVAENVVCEYDANICEGVKVVYQNLLYNYSIYEARKKNERIY